MGLRIGGGIGPVRASAGVPRGCGPLFFGGLAIILAGFWPWLLGTHIALSHGVQKNSTGYNLAGWIPEAAWLALLLAILVWVVKRSMVRNATRAQQLQELAQHRARMTLTNTPWFDPAIRAYTHSTCSIRHRSEGAAARCNSRV